MLFFDKAVLPSSGIPLEQWAYCSIQTVGFKDTDGSSRQLGLAPKHTFILFELIFLFVLQGPGRPKTSVRRSVHQ
jgi:hypothetical protein